MESITLPNILFFSSLALLIIVSGGVIYLTAIEWRDARARASHARRLRDQDKKVGR
ncbi:hypothetical protein [Chroococcus sp. FPU101]|uniref:hypothetical protein n=1 Tax=Chroococcus sp. FPU101 TaxID=1974212 RepID=UPI001A8CEC1E|nr:hypothetical protein [Chroococcus sp. FPU101]